MKSDTMTGETLDRRELLKVLTAFKRGNFSVRMAEEKTGLAGKIADTLNDMANLASDLNDIVSRLVNEEHTPGEIGELLIAFELTTEQIRGHSDTIDGKLYALGDRLKTDEFADRVKS